LTPTTCACTPTSPTHRFHAPLGGQRSGLCQGPSPSVMPPPSCWRAAARLLLHAWTLPAARGCRYLNHIGQLASERMEVAGSTLWVEIRSSSPLWDGRSMRTNCSPTAPAYFSAQCRHHATSMLLQRSLLASCYVDAATAHTAGITPRGCCYSAHCCHHVHGSCDRACTCYGPCLLQRTQQPFSPCLLHGALLV